MNSKLTDMMDDARTKRRKWKSRKSEMSKYLQLILSNL